MAEVFKLGIVQLPFFTCNILLLRFAVARRRSGTVMLVAFCSLAVNLALNLLFMRVMGVAGIALATTLATGVSAALMLLTLNRLDDVAWATAVAVAIIWMLFLTLMLCLYYRSPVGVFIAAGAMAAWAAGSWRQARSFFGWRVEPAAPDVPGAR